MNVYRTVEKAFFAELSFKKSRFIACLYPATDEEEIELVIEEVKERYPKATHYCVAAILRQTGRCWEKMSDDGEPSGTAGRPMLDVLRGSGLENVIIVVVRYFGGTLLGTGGLVRAYSDTSKEVLKTAEVVEMTPVIPMMVKMEYAYYSQFENKCRQDTLGPVDIEFLENISISLKVAVEEKERFVAKLMDLTNRSARITEQDQIFIPLRKS